MLSLGTKTRDYGWRAAVVDEEKVRRHEQKFLWVDHITSTILHSASHLWVGTKLIRAVAKIASPHFFYHPCLLFYSSPWLPYMGTRLCVCQESCLSISFLQDFPHSNNRRTAVQSPLATDPNLPSVILQQQHSLRSSFETRRLSQFVSMLPFDIISRYQNASICYNCEYVLQIQVKLEINECSDSMKF